MFRTSALIRFAHVDGAGIVFYPRYLEIVNAALEDFFADVVGVDFNQLHLAHGLAIPTVNLICAFAAPSRLGDVVDIVLDVMKLGNSSAILRFTFTCAGQLRLTAELTIVCMDLASARATPWPDDLRAHLAVSQPSGDITHA